MITFKQFLSEQEMISFAVLIHRNCKQFIEEAQGAGFLLRGVKGLSDIESHSAMDAEGNEMEYGIKTVRQDRKPLDFTKVRSEIIDDWFMEKFGIRARSQCMFAGGNGITVGELKHYGTPCVVFPVGAFKYVWSPEVGDLYGKMNIPWGDKTAEQWTEETHAFLENQKYQTDGLDAALRTNNEIMIKCDSYYAFPIEYQEQMKQALGFA